LLRVTWRERSVIGEDLRVRVTLLAAVVIEEAALDDVDGCARAIRHLEEDLLLVVGYFRERGDEAARAVEGHAGFVIDIFTVRGRGWRDRTLRCRSGGRRWGLRRSASRRRGDGRRGTRGRRSLGLGRDASAWRSAWRC